MEPLLACIAMMKLEQFIVNVLVIEQLILVKISTKFYLLRISMVVVSIPHFLMHEFILLDAFLKGQNRILLCYWGLV